MGFKSPDRFDRDDVVKVVLNSVFGQVVKKVRLGLPSGSRGATGGSFLVDGYLSTR